MSTVSVTVYITYFIISWGPKMKKSIEIKHLLLWNWSMNILWFQQPFYSKLTWLSSEKPPLISSPAHVLTVCALSVTVAAISHILFILGSSLHTFVLISKCRVSCSQLEGGLSVYWRAVLGTNRGNKKLGWRPNLISRHMQRGCWANNKSYPAINLTIQRQSTHRFIKEKKEEEGRGKLRQCLLCGW